MNKLQEKVQELKEKNNNKDMELKDAKRLILEAEHKRKSATICV